MGKLGRVLPKYSFGYANYCPVFCPAVAKIPQFPFVNSEVTRPMFTKFLHDVEPLPPLLMRALTGDIAIRCGTPEYKVHAVNVDVCK